MRTESQKDTIKFKLSGGPSEVNPCLHFQVEDEDEFISKNPSPSKENRNKNIYMIEINGQKVKWIGNQITGWNLKKLANESLHKFSLWQKVINSKDRLIENLDVINLNLTEVYRYYTIPLHTKAGDVIPTNILPRQDVEYLKKYQYKTIGSEHQTGVVLCSFDLPQGKFDHNSTDILILLPPGYPDLSPDMFYCNPWLRISNTNVFPNCADVPFSFEGINWQRWSRHNNTWRPGIDGIKTMITRVQTALEEA